MLVSLFSLVKIEKKSMKQQDNKLNDFGINSNLFNFKIIQF
jgi:hypothetical protein